MMIGTIIYLFLDVSFNVALWTSEKTIKGVINLVNYSSNSIKNYNSNNKKNLLELEPPSYEDIIINNSLDENISIEENDDFIIVKKTRDEQIKKLLEIQKETLLELKKLIDN